MPLLKRPKDQLRRGSRVKAVEPIGAVPEGTVGTVKLIDGLDWVRYWVAWETGDWIGSIDGSQIVAAERYEDLKRERADAAQRAASPPPAQAAEDGSAEEAAPAAGGGRVPEHLLERSRQARARRAAADG